MTGRRALSLLVASFLLGVSVPVTISQSAGSPLILIYSGDTPEWGQGLSDLIEEDGRFDAEILIIQDRPTFETVVNFPRVQATIICPLQKERMALGDVSDLTTAYFLDGGAVMGIGVACTTRYAPELGPVIFSISGNRSLSSKRMENRRVFVYNRKEVIPEINGGIETDPLYMEGYLAFYSADATGNHVEIPCNGTRHVLYEGDRSAPLMVAFESEDGGSSIAFPGLTVQSVEGKDNYYGLLLERPEFKELFLNGLRWAIDNSPRYQRLLGSSAQALEDEANRRADLAEEAQKLEKRIESRRLLRLGILWAVGLVFCLAVVFKFVVIRD